MPEVFIICHTEWWNYLQEKMKSREGTVVDADDLIAEVIAEARKSAEERGEIEGLTEQEKMRFTQRSG